LNFLKEEIKSKRIEEKLSSEILLGSYRISQANVFSKFDMKSGFWQIQIHEEDKYKIAFVTPFGHYEWNIMPFRLKNTPNEFQNIMNEIFDPIAHFSAVYIDDVLIFSKSIDEHWKYLIWLSSIFGD
jgi:hypothetical protein